MPQDPTATWPSLPYAAWKDTLATLHLWTQIVGKVRLARTPWINHSWHVTLYPTPRGLTTSQIPHGGSTFEMTFDFFSHELRIATSDGALGVIELRPMTVAHFYARVMSALDGFALHTEIHAVPSEIEDPIPFAGDEVHGDYDPEYANRFARVVSASARVMSDFRGGFIGKSSPVHFFWGGFDLAVTRFSGRRAPPHPGGVPGLPDRVSREAYSHEVASAGFWPGAESHPEAIFYAYGYPTPAGMSTASVRPVTARWDVGLGEFVLPYESMRRLPDPDTALMAFLRSTYEAVAGPGGWDREALEWPEGRRPRLHSP